MELKHYGVQGMKWGERKQKRAVQNEQKHIKKFLNTFGALTIGPLVFPISAGAQSLGIVSPTVRKTLKEQKTITKERNKEQKVKYNTLVTSSIPNGKHFVERFGIK